MVRARNKQQKEELVGKRVVEKTYRNSFFIPLKTSKFIVVTSKLPVRA